MNTPSLAENLNPKEYRSRLLRAEHEAGNRYNDSRRNTATPVGDDALWNEYQEAVAARRAAGIDAGDRLDGGE